MITYRFRANNKEKPVLLNGQPAFVDVAEAWLRIDVRSDPTFREIQSRFPNASDDGDPPLTFSRMEPLDCGCRFLFSFGLKNGCHACEEIGHASIAFDFESAGRFQGANLDIDPGCIVYELRKFLHFNLAADRCQQRRPRLDSG